jgi:PBSX family phage terminase large subunit
MLGGEATHNMLFGGSRSGKTFLLVRAVIIRALRAKESRHAILRFRFNHIKASIVLDTFPKVMRLCFPKVFYKVDKTDWFAELPNRSQIWFGGLDDKQRTEKILGQEYVTGYLNECSQIPQSSRDMFVTRIAQQVQDSEGNYLVPKMYYDCNPPSKAHWSYVMFIKKRDPETKKPFLNPKNYDSLQINPFDNEENLSKKYIEELHELNPRLRKRFLDGEFADATPNALFAEETIEKWRVIDDSVPEMIKIVVAVDPSGSGDTDNVENDAIGIVVAGLGYDGNAYLIEDCTVKAGPAVWGKVATDAYARHEANVVVGESNYGGAMVEHVIKTADRMVPYKGVHASRGKSIRAEPVSALYDQGKVRHVGYFPELEDELVGFSTMGYLGENSPNRADAAIWALTELFPGVVRPRKEFEPQHYQQSGSWMSM